jgi:hypothetical protein
MQPVKQISIFAENSVGKIEKITQTLADSNINILAINITSMGDFGVIKLVVDKPDQGLDSLKKEGFTVSLSDVLAIEMDDKPGGLNKAAQFLSKNRVNVENAYVLVTDSRKTALLLIEVKDIERTKKILENYK